MTDIDGVASRKPTVLTGAKVFRDIDTANAMTLSELDKVNGVFVQLLMKALSLSKRPRPSVVGMANTHT